MCGLTGLLVGARRRPASLVEATERMIAPIRHRGPDDSGIWVDEDCGVALGFRRLAIIDLSEQGHQPMQSATGRFTMIFNGEVFNHAVLRRELESLTAFRGHSDTEVMLAAFEAWGIEAAVRRFVGMFAIAVWDVERRELTLIRDRLGIKPMFIYSDSGLISFGSELKALQAGPRFDRTLDLDAVASYLRYLYVPAPRTIFANAVKLLPGHLITVRDADQPLPPSVPYWSLEEAARSGLSNRLDGSDTEVIDQLQALLFEAIGMRMEADVPLGALLSGGVDSSTVIAIMQRLSDRPVKTFSIGFDDKVHDESAHAAAIARHLGTDHTELQLTGHDALAVVPQLAEMFDEPLADPSQIPTYLVSKLARQWVTVALSGDGGDELFAGYNRYVFGEQVIRRAGQWPGPFRRLAAAGLTSMGPGTWDRLHSVVAPILPEAAKPRLVGAKLIKMGNLLVAESEAARYRSLVSAWQDPAILMADARPRPVADGADDSAWPPTLLQRMMLADQRTYLPDDLLAKVDRASMAVSLEARVPLLDHRIVEFSWRIPRRMMVREKRGKWILRQVLHRMIPQNLVDRPKVGFTVPIEAWLRGPLSGWAGDLLAEGHRQDMGALDWERVNLEWQRFAGGDGSSATGLWAVLQLVAWHARWC